MIGYCFSYIDDDGDIMTMRVCSSYCDDKTFNIHVVCSSHYDNMTFIATTRVCSSHCDEKRLVVTL
jgi:hypothetical protein